MPKAPTATTATPLAAVARQNALVGRRPPTLAAVAGVVTCSAMATTLPGTRSTPAATVANSAEMAGSVGSGQGEAATPPCPWILTTWAEAERLGTALVIASGFLSNPAKDWLTAYERNRHPPFRVRHWEKPALERMLANHPSLMAKHGIIAEEVRTLAEIIAAEQEYFDKVWYVRKQIREEKVEHGEAEPLSPELAAQVEVAMRAIEERYGTENVGPLGRLDLGIRTRQARRTTLGTWQRVGLSRHVDPEPSRPVQAERWTCHSRARSGGH